MKWFLEKLSKLFAGSRADSAAVALPDVVSPSEDATRFILRDRHYSRIENRPKQSAFMPEEYGGRWETSVCRISTVPEQRIWHLGRTVRPGLAAVARADFPVQAALDEMLACVPATEAFPEHAVLTNWPAADDGKARQKAAASALVEAATLRFPP